MTDAIVQTAREHLEEARKLSCPVQDDGALQSRWLAVSERMYEAAQTLQTCRDTLYFAQSTQIPFDHRMNADDVALDKYLALLYDEFPHYRLEFGDNPQSLPETITGRCGHLVSNIFFWHLRNAWFCRKHVAPKTILEVGGGYGTQARIWLNSGIECYTIVDLPESLFFSEVALTDEFPGAIAYWPQTARVTLVPVGRMDEYTAPSDLVLNIGSLQEMSEPWVAHYMAWLDRYPARFFYSLNYMGSPLAEMWEGRCFWAPRPSKIWTTRALNPGPPLTKIMCAERAFAEVLYERSDPTARFYQWSALNGRYLDRITYLEGLELLRQDMTPDNAKTFINTVMYNVASKGFAVPKELYPIAADHDPQLFGELSAMRLKIVD